MAECGRPRAPANPGRTGRRSAVRHRRSWERSPNVEPAPRASRCASSPGTPDCVNLSGTAAPTLCRACGAGGRSSSGRADLHGGRRTAWARGRFESVGRSRGRGARQGSTHVAGVRRPRCQRRCPRTGEFHEVSSRLVAKRAVPRGARRDVAVAPGRLVALVLIAGLVVVQAGCQSGPSAAAELRSVRLPQADHRPHPPPRGRAAATRGASAGGTAVEYGGTVDRRRCRAIGAVAVSRRDRHRSIVTRAASARHSDRTRPRKAESVPCRARAARPRVPAPGTTSYYTRPVADADARSGSIAGSLTEAEPRASRRSPRPATDADPARATTTPWIICRRWACPAK